MIRGAVTRELDPVVTIEVGDGNGLYRSLEVVVDTGFTGELSLPYDEIQRLNLTRVDSIPVFLANGQRISSQASQIYGDDSFGSPGFLSCINACQAGH